MSALRTTVLSAIASLLVIGVSSQPASAVVLNSYEFDADLSDNLANGLDLVSSGGIVGGGRYSFSGNQGLRLDNALFSTSDYYIEMKLQMTNNSSWSKFIDFENLSMDFGLYALGDRLQFYNDTSGGPTSIPLNTDVVVGIDRNGVTGQVIGTVNGIQQWSFTDTFSHAVSSANKLHFFIDDFATGQGESFIGSVDYIRIHDASRSAVPEPSTALLLGLGMLGAGLIRRKRRA